MGQIGRMRWKGRMGRGDEWDRGKNGTDGTNEANRADETDGTDRVDGTIELICGTSCAVACNIHSNKTIT